MKHEPRRRPRNRLAKHMDTLLRRYVKSHGLREIVASFGLMAAGILFGGGIVFSAGACFVFDASRNYEASAHWNGTLREMVVALLINITLSICYAGVRSYLKIWADKLSIEMGQFAQHKNQKAIELNGKEAEPRTGEIQLP